MAMSRAICVKYYIACEVPLSLCCKSGLRYVRLKCEKDHDLGKKSRLASGNTCYHSVHNVACTHL